MAGDLNDNPASGALDPLLQRTNLRDAISLRQYAGDFPGTYQRATAAEKIDYLLLSPELRKRVRAVDVYRKGFYAQRGEPRQVSGVGSSLLVGGGGSLGRPGNEAGCYQRCGRFCLLQSIACATLIALGGRN